MDSRLASRFERLEAARATLVERLSRVDEETLNRRPRDDAWSVIQVLHHVMLAEELSVGYIERKSADTASVRAGWIESLRSWALAVAMRSPLRFAAPPMTTELPERDSLRDVAVRWEANRAHMQAALGRIASEVVDRAIYRHPVVGRMSVDQAVRFFEDHLAHHERQIDRTLEAVTSTGG